MDAENIKILILEKLFNDIIPKIISSEKIFNPDRNDWSFFKTNNDEGDNVITNFSISIFLDNLGNFESCSINIHQQRRIRQNIRRLAMLGELPQFYEENNNNELELTNSNEEFNNKDLAIKKICELMNLKSVIHLGQSEKKQLDIINSVDGMHLGTIRNILNIPENLDITNLETRKVLLEKLK